MKKNADWYVWLVIALLSLFIILTSCRTTRQETPQPPVELLIIRDSTVINRIDSITIIPVERSMSVGRDSSHLETSLAESDAWTDSTGLHHNIRNKAGIQKVTKSDIRYIIKDSIHERPVPYPVEVEVPAQFTRWQSAQMWVGRIAMIFVICCCLYKLLKKT